MAPNASTHPAPAGSARVCVIHLVVNVALQTARAPASITAAVATAIPLLGARHTGWFFSRRRIPSQPPTKVGTLTTVNVVLATERTDVGALVERDQRVHTCHVALGAPWN